MDLSIAEGTPYAAVHGGKVIGTPTETGFSMVVRGGQVKALRGCTIDIVVTPTTKINRNDAVALLADIKDGDHVNVKGTTAPKEGGGVTFTATRVAASGPDATS